MRYKQLDNIISKYKPKTICEIGTWSGDRALQMIKSSVNAGVPNVFYKGYDMFEDFTPEIDAKEFNVKPHFTIEQVRNKLGIMKMMHKQFSFELVKGNTNETLKDEAFDLVYLDGGHSIETIRNDVEKLKRSKIIVFDDYYLPDVDNADFHIRSWVNLLNEIGIKVDPVELHRKHAGKTNVETLRGILGDRFSEQELVVFASRKESLYREAYRPHLKAVPGLPEFLDQASTTGLPMALALQQTSTTSPWSWMDWEYEITLR